METKFNLESCIPSPNAKITYCILYNHEKCPKTCEYAREQEAEKIRRGLDRLLQEDMRDF